MTSVIAIEEVVFEACDFDDFVHGILEILNALNLKILTFTDKSKFGGGFTLAQYWDLLERLPKLGHIFISIGGPILTLVGNCRGTDVALSPAEKRLSPS